MSLKVVHDFTPAHSQKSILFGDILAFWKHWTVSVWHNEGDIIFGTASVTNNRMRCSNEARGLRKSILITIEYQGVVQDFSYFQ